MPSAVPKCMLGNYVNRSRYARSVPRVHWCNVRRQWPVNTGPTSPAHYSQPRRKDAGHGTARRPVRQGLPAGEPGKVRNRAWPMTRFPACFFLYNRKGIRLPVCVVAEAGVWDSFWTGVQKTRNLSCHLHFIFPAFQKDLNIMVVQWDCSDNAFSMV